MIFLRKANDNDLELMRAWRSSPLIWEGMYSQKAPIDWYEHLDWWHSRPQSWICFIIELFENDYIRPIGVVNIGQMEHWSPEIGYFIDNPTDWGKGYGTEAVRQACEWLKKHGKEYCHTTIKDDNVASIKLIEKLGFKCGDVAREGEHWYHKQF